MSQNGHRVAIVVAVIGVIGTIGAALIGNWDKIFPTRRTSDGPRPAEVGKKPAETIVRDVRRDPEKTTKALLEAWNNRDQDTALKFAEDSAVKNLFSTSPETLKVSSKDLTCYLAGTRQRHCQIAGVLSFTLIETDQGWWVKSVEY
jgi:hypothetical protein